MARPVACTCGYLPYQSPKLCGVLYEQNSDQKLPQDSVPTLFRVSTNVMVGLWVVMVVVVVFVVVRSCCNSGNLIREIDR